MEALKTACEKYRLCPPLATCESFPCAHSSFSTNEDYLLNMQDLFKHPDFYSKIWSLFHDRKNLSPEVLTEYAVYLDRCQRITDNRQQINEETEANLEIYLEEAWGLPRRKKNPITEEELDAMKKSIIERWSSEVVVLRPRKESKEQELQE